MAVCFKENMRRDSRYKQIKTCLKKDFDMNDGESQSNADKLNLACRVYDKLPIVVQNCSGSGLDIRDLTMNELSLAHRMSWVLRKKALSSISKRTTSETPLEIDEGSVQQSINDLLARDGSWKRKKIQV